MKRLFVLLAVFATAVLSAAVLNGTWTNATKNTDGSALPTSGAGSIVSTRIEYGTCVGGAFGVKAGEVIVQGSASTAVTPNLNPGTWCLRAAHTNTYGNEGPWSNVAQKIISEPTPGAPTNLNF